MTPDQLPAMFEAIQARVNDAAGTVVLGLAYSYQARVQGVTLRLHSHGVDLKTNAPPGGPPAWVLGNLARSVEVKPIVTQGPVAIASVAPHVVYARLQELGGHIYPKRHRFLRFPLNGRIYYKEHVYVPPRPYMRPTTDAMVADGSFTERAMATFEFAVWGWRR